MDDIDPRLLQAKRLIDDEPDEALSILWELLDEDPNDPMALFLVGYVYIFAQRTALAYQIMARCVELQPDRPEPLINLGRCADELGRKEEALGLFQKAQALRETPETLNNLSVIWGQLGDYEKSRDFADRALAANPLHIEAAINRGTANLALHNWREGWRGYNAGLGYRFRKKWDYGRPDWEGEPGASVVFHGEQGIGDEIMFASCIPDAISDCKKVILDVDPRLEGLFKRSFPDAIVHGTRRDAGVDWLDREDPDYQSAIGRLPEFYRNSDSDFPGTPYLVADMERRTMWRALFKAWGKPVIGLAWSGGLKLTQAKDRAIPLEAFYGVRAAHDAVYVSLQYKNPGESMPQGVRHYPWAAEAYDFDDLAAMVAELDGVVGIHTASLHLAGALGVPTACLVPARPAWRYAGNDMPWYGSMRLFKQGYWGESWQECIDRHTDGIISWLKEARKHAKRNEGRALRRAG